MNNKLIRCLRAISLMLVSMALVISGTHTYGEEITKIEEVKELVSIEEQQRQEVMQSPYSDVQETEEESEVVSETEEVTEAEQEPETEQKAEPEKEPEVEQQETYVEPSSPGMGVHELSNYQYGGVFNNMLFIGDSRTQSLYDFGEMSTEATFFCQDGLSIYGLEKTLNVPGVGATTLVNLLSTHQYTRIYLMIGINEIGCDKDQNMRVYREWVNRIMELQPGAQLVLQANLHVTGEFALSNADENNVNLDYVNGRMRALAEEKGLVFVDANVIFDNGAGAMRAEYTNDGVHPKVHLYSKWAYWLAYYVNYN